jgi:Peptidase inhibitor I78 family
MADNKDRKIEDLLNKDARFMRSPLLWFCLLAIPVLLSLYTAFIMKAPPETPPRPVAEGVAEPGSPGTSETQTRAFMPDDFAGERPVMGAAQPFEGRGAVVTRSGYAQDHAPPPLAAAECRFDDLVGKPADAPTQDAIKAQNRAVRVLGPGAMMTQDYSPSRVNLETDADGKITRVWCG